MDKTTIRSSIKQELISNALIKGTILASLGIIPMLYGALFLNKETLGTWGIGLYLSGMALIAIGLIPYRNLSRAQKNPNEIIISEDESITYKSKGKLAFTLPIKEIHSIRYLEREHLYGIELIINGKSVFLPYFTEKSYERVKSQIE